jgi:hypothetical protein
MFRCSAIWSDALKKVLQERTQNRQYLCRDGKVYYMSLVGEDITTVTNAVNQGIDAYLEVCFVPDRGDSYSRQTPPGIAGKVSGPRLECYVSPESLVVLIRRLMESEKGLDLASSICDTLDIELI